MFAAPKEKENTKCYCSWWRYIINFEFEVLLFFIFYFFVCVWWKKFKKLQKRIHFRENYKKKVSALKVIISLSDPLSLGITQKNKTVASCSCSSQVELVQRDTLYNEEHFWKSVQTMWKLWFHAVKLYNLHKIGKIW